MKPRLTLRWKLFLLFLIPFLISLWWIGKAGQFGKEGFPWLFFFLIFLPVLAIWFWGISRILIQPLKEISDVAGKFAEGLFNWRIRLAERRDELSALGEQLNRMAEAMGEKIEGLSKALAESQALLNGMEEGVLILDLHGRVRKMNTSMEAVLSHAYPTDIGKHYLEVFRDPELNEIIQTTLKEKKGQRRGLSPLGRPGKTFQVQSSLIQYPQNGGEGVIVVFHDITELKRLERIRQDFVANVSHELRTPLTTIRGYVEALQDGNLEDRSQAKQFLTDHRTTHAADGKDRLRSSAAFGDRVPRPNAQKRPPPHCGVDILSCRCPPPDGRIETADRSDGGCFRSSAAEGG